MRPTDRISEAIEQSIVAEQLGFDSVWLAEHHFSNYGLLPHPLLAAVKIAARTSTIRIATGVLVLPLYHPLRVVEELALADHLTEGRLIAGIGRGYQEHEFSRFGVDLSESRGRLEETVDIMLAAWNNDEFEYQGRFFQIPRTTVQPRPFQQPHPPIWFACGSPESVRYAVKRGFMPIATTGLRPREAAMQVLDAHRQAVTEFPSTPYGDRFALQRTLYVLGPHDDPEAIAQEALWAHRVGNRLRDHAVYGGFVDDGPIHGEPSVDQVLADRAVIGDAETVVEKLQADVDAGVTYINCFMNFGRLTNEQVIGSMQRFAEHVIPELRRRNPDVGEGLRNVSG